MIHCIVGHGASGKTTVQNYLKSFIPTIITYTTRPMRKNEVDGFHYHFIDNERFRQRIKENFFIEHYYVEKNEWFYGFSLNDIPYKERDYILVIDPNGYKSLIKKIGKEFVKCYYIKIDERERAKRMLERGDNLNELFRRIFADREDFKDFEAKADYILESFDSHENADKILDSIKERAF